MSLIIMTPYFRMSLPVWNAVYLVFILFAYVLFFWWHFAQAISIYLVRKHIFLHGCHLWLQVMSLTVLFFCLEDLILGLQFLINSYVYVKADLICHCVNGATHKWKHFLLLLENLVYHSLFLSFTSFNSFFVFWLVRYKSDCIINHSSICHLV